MSRRKEVIRMDEDQVKAWMRKLHIAIENNREPEISEAALELMEGVLINLARIAHSVDPRRNEPA
jgi:hypothetical protein